MRSWMLGTLVVLTAGLSAAADKPEAIIETAIQAHGGKDTLAKFKAMSGDMAGTIRLPFGEAKFQGQFWSEPPDKFRMTMTVPVGGADVTLVQLVNGKTVRMTVNGMAQPLSDRVEAELRSVAAVQEVGRLLPLLDATKYTLKAGDKAQVDGRPATTVTVTSDDVGSIELAFDDKTGYLVRTSRKGVSPEGVEVTEANVVSEFKNIRGVMMATKTVVTHDGKPFMSATFSNIEAAERLPAETLAEKD